MQWARLVLLAAVLCLCQADFTERVYTAVLSSDNVVPIRGESPGVGAAVCALDYNSDPYQLDCEVSFEADPVNGPFYAAIYRGGVSENGPLVYEFQVEIVDHFREVFSLRSVTLEGKTNKYAVKDQVRDFLNGLWYIAITSEPYPFGVMRGSLTLDHQIYSRLSSGRVLPRQDDANRSSARGVALGTYTEYEPRRTANFLVVHNVENPTLMEIHEGNPQQIGAVDHTFTAATSPREETVQYTPQEEARLFDAEQYLLVESVLYPRGEIRGQLQMVDQMPPISFTARMDGSSMEPRPVTTVARGCALFSLDCHNMVLEYFVYHSVDSPTGAWMNLGAAGTAGSRIWPLARAENPIYGTRILTPTEILAFYEGTLYVTIESLVRPEGEIRGQITNNFDYYAYLSPSQVVPPRTNNGVGCATLRLNEQTSNGQVLNYDIHFTIPQTNDASVDLVQGVPGLVGDTYAHIGDSTDSVSGSGVRLTESQARTLRVGDAFIHVGDSSLQGGRAVLRGQVLPLSSTLCPFVTTREQVRPKTPTSSFAQLELPSYFEWNGPASTLPSAWPVIMFGVFLTFFLAYLY